MRDQLQICGEVMLMSFIVAPVDCHKSEATENDGRLSANCQILH